MGDIFGDFFGQGRGRSRSASRRGQDIEARLTITLEEAVFGVEKLLDISKEVVCAHCHGNGVEPGSKINICKRCNGRGQVEQTQNTFLGAFRTVGVCPDCNGEGKLAEKKCGQCNGRGAQNGKERIKAKIPAGIKSGESLRLSGQGEAGQTGAPAGDLYINVQVLQHKSFARQGDNLHTVKTIQFSQAALGDKVEVVTLDGKVNLKIPAGTPAGRQFIIKNRGSLKLRGRGRGDLIVEVKVAVPDDLSRSQKKILEDLQKAGL